MRSIKKHLNENRSKKLYIVVGMYIKKRTFFNARCVTTDYVSKKE